MAMVMLLPMVELIVICVTISRRINSSSRGDGSGGGKVVLLKYYNGWPIAGGKVIVKL